MKAPKGKDIHLNTQGFGPLSKGKFSTANYSGLLGGKVLQVDSCRNEGREWRTGSGASAKVASLRLPVTVHWRRTEFLL